MSVSPAVTDQAFPLDRELADKAVRPEEKAFGEARSAWNLAVDQRPAAVVFAETAEDVRATVRLAAARGIPEPVRGKSFVIVEAYHLGEPAQADELLAPLRALGPATDTITTVPVPVVSHLHMDPEQPVPYAGDGMLLADLPHEAVDAFVQVSGATAAFPLLSVEIRHLGGELARPRPANGALASIDAQYILHAIGMTPDPQASAAVTEQAAAVKQALAPWAARHAYLNFAETATPAGPLWTEQAYHRLRRIKAQVDPHDLIRANHPIPPTR